MGQGSFCYDEILFVGLMCTDSGGLLGRQIIFLNHGRKYYLVTVWE